MCAKHDENPTMLSRVTAKNVGDVFFETHCSVVLSVNLVSQVKNDNETLQQERDQLINQ